MNIYLLTLSSFCFQIVWLVIHPCDKQQELYVLQFWRYFVEHESLSYYLCGCQWHFLVPPFFQLGILKLVILFSMNERWCSLSQCWMPCIYLVVGKFYSGLSPFFSFELLVVCFFCLVSVVELLILEAHPGLGFGMCIKYLCRVHGQMQKLSYFGEQLRELSLKRSHETPSFSFRGSLFSSFYASCMKT